MEIKRTFEQGTMNKDLDERLVPNGFFIDAQNVTTSTNVGSDYSVVKNLLSNKQVTNLDLGQNAECVKVFSNESTHNIYMFIVSDSMACIVEYNHLTNSSSFVLKDTRSHYDRVLRIDKINGIKSVACTSNTEKTKDLLIFTNGVDEIYCVNIERAKTYGENNFEKDDITLIKKPPIHAPKVTMFKSNDESNELEDNFVCFCYRYMYLDGEYSARSPMTYYKFSPSDFKISYENLENESMKNIYNSACIFFNTGDKRVSKIQVLAKFSNSNNLYIIETFDKECENWGDNEIQSIIYSNKKIYSVLPEDEIYRVFDNVPRKAEALTLMGNRLIVANYTEGYNLLHRPTDFFATGVETKIKNDYKVEIQSENIFNSETIPYVLQNNNFKLCLDNQQILINNGSKFQIDLHLSNSLNNKTFLKEVLYFETSFEYNSISSLFHSSEFQIFINSVNEVIKDKHLETAVEFNGQTDASPKIVINTEQMCLELNAVNDVKFNDETEFKIFKTAHKTSLKSNQSYEVGIVYEDEYKRSTSVLSCKKNTAFIPISKSDHQNKIKVSINHKPPYWAKTYRFAIKTKPLNYYNVIVNKFFQEDEYAWMLLEGDNKDKVKENDVLLLKATPLGNVSKVIKSKVLEVKVQEKDFIKGNKDKSGNDIIEPYGLYAKINPKGFSMGNNDFNQYSDTSKGQGIKDNFAKTCVSLFSTNNNGIYTHLELQKGSMIELYIKSSVKYDSGWSSSILNKTYYTTEYFSSLGEWFNENIVGKNIWANEGNAPDNLKNKIVVKKGVVEPFIHDVGVVSFQISPDNNKGEYIEVTSTKLIHTKGRKNYLDVSIKVRTSEGVYIFENHPKKDSDLDIYYLSEEVFDVSNGYHLGNVTSQSENTPAISVLDFFNCYSFENGMESYKILDAFNGNALNIDYSPTTTTDDYKELKHFAEITWSEVYSNSSGVNRLNEFNSFKANWKELDKHFGAIQVIHPRNNDLLVIQEDKWGQVLYYKNALHSADGENILTSSTKVLGDYVPFSGEYGITDIHSFSYDGNRCYGVDKKRGTILRLSIDGLSEITYGMSNYFKKLFTKRYNSKVIGSFDPYSKSYNICIDENHDKIDVLQCGQVVSKYNTTEIGYFKFVLNNIIDNSLLSYNVSNGSVKIIAKVNDNISEFNDISGIGNIVLPYSSTLLLNDNDNPTERFVNIEIIPISNNATYEISNICAIGYSLKIHFIVLSSIEDNGLRFVKSLIRNGYADYHNEIQLMSEQNHTLQTINGNQGVGIFPENGNTLLIPIDNNQFYGNTKVFNPETHKFRYFYSDTTLNMSTIDQTIESATQPNYQWYGDNYLVYDFVFNRPTNNHDLYLIYDLRNE